METNALKRFATAARIKIIEGVRKKLHEELGYDENGIAVSQPKLVQGSAIFRGEYVDESFYYQWRALDNAIQKKGLETICEEVAYTWFNRLVAIRILQRNGFIQPVLSFDNPEIRVPHIVSEARQGRFPELNADERLKLLAIIGDATKTYEQFSLLLIAFCHHTPIIQRCFGSINDYTELLLPRAFLEKDGFIDMLNNTPFITEEDYRTTELLGWLYQFYNSERKDEVFAAKGKFEANDIAPATQIFTPNWIVKYMVQNTIGRIYLDNNPDTEFEAQMEYLVKSSETSSSLRGAEGDEAIYKFTNLEELRIADLACGSGHILLEAFDLLYSMYIKAFYSRREAIESIFRHNLTGIDLDTRAKQLAMFALLLKACQKDESFLDASVLPNVLDMPKVDKYTWVDNRSQFLCNEAVSKELEVAFDLMKDADTLGSIMQFKISTATREFIQSSLRGAEGDVAISQAFRLILALTEDYSAIVMNPPYMGGGNMNAVLSKYVKDNYEEGKADLCTVFMMMQSQRLANNGYYANIIPPSWMFLSSFEALRKGIISNDTISSLLHLSRGVFGADFGSVSCVIRKGKTDGAKGTYFRLIERTFQEFDQKHLKELFEKTLENHSFRYYFADYDKDVEEITYSENGAKIYYPAVSQDNFSKIPGCPIGYWVSENLIDSFGKHTISDYGFAGIGMRTGDNKRFLRLWFEPSIQRIGIGLPDANNAIASGKKWIPYNKGGEFRLWYGNNDYVVNWENDGYEIKENTKLVYPFLGEDLGWKISNEGYYFKAGITWSGVTSGRFGCRYYGKGFIFDSGANGLFVNEEFDKFYIVGLLNSKQSNFIINVINPTINTGAGVIRQIPVKYNDDTICDISILVQQNIAISRADWDAHETSWDFQQNELIAARELCGHNCADLDMLDEEEQKEIEASSHIPTNANLLSDCIAAYKGKWERNFRRLHANEEELNRQFIEIYGLQDELTPDVPLSEITILQQGEISIEKEDN